MSFLSVFLLGMSSVANSQIDAPPELQPAGLNPGDTFFVIFVTSQQQNYNRSATSAEIDVDGVNSAAGGSETSGVVGWRSLYGFETNAGAGTLNTMDAAEAWGNVTDRPIFTTTGVRVANDRADMLDNTLLAPIGSDENGNAPTNTQVFTGLTNTGAIAAAALGDDQGAGAQFGLNTSVTGTWAQSALADVNRHLYVLSPLLRMPLPAASVPVPTLPVFGLAILAGLLGLFGLRRLKR
ncbi:MAG: IPTL-CTERM sorting domain-containing protein [Halioglobus sp.]